MRAVTTYTESAFQSQVLQLAKLCGWRSAHFRPALTRRGRWVTAVQGDGKGFPDLILLRGLRLVVAELKSERGRLTLEQADWLDAWRLVPSAEVYIWTPASWDEIDRVLLASVTAPR